MNIHQKHNRVTMYIPEDIRPFIQKAFKRPCDIWEFMRYIRPHMEVLLSKDPDVAIEYVEKSPIGKKMHEIMLNLPNDPVVFTGEGVPT